MNYSIRNASEHDLPDIIDVFTSAIHSLCAPDYNLAERNAWASSADDLERWKSKVHRQYFLVALAGAEIIGFASLENDVVDLLYVDKDYGRKGVASTLLSRLEEKAIRDHRAFLSADVSKTALEFFVKKGFDVVSKQSKVIDSIEIINFKMKKKLISS